MRLRSAFTLIELLVVVAIIAILAAIAVPNFLEAQTRAKVSRAKTELRVLATGLEAYHVDNRAYPQAILVPPPFRLRALSTPIAYLSTIPEDVFKQPPRQTGGPFSFSQYSYGAMGPERASRYALASDGPDRNNDTDPIQYYPGYTSGLFYGQVAGFNYTLYDPTNGTISIGDIFRASDYTPAQ